MANAWAKGPVKLARAAAALGQEVAGGQLLLGYGGQGAALPKDLPPAAACWRKAHGQGHLGHTQEQVAQ